VTAYPDAPESSRDPPLLRTPAWHPYWVRVSVRVDYPLLYLGSQRRAAVALAPLRGAIEVIHVHLPGRVAEVTDPLLALIFAFAFGQSERRQNLRSDSLAR
jgi:hypothetical protein